MIEPFSTCEGIRSSWALCSARVKVKCANKYVLHFCSLIGHSYVHLCLGPLLDSVPHGQAIYILTLRSNISDSCVKITILCAFSRKHYPLCMFAILWYIFFYNYHLLNNYFLKPLQGCTVRVLFRYYHTVYETIRSGRFKVVTVQGNRKP